MIFLSTSGPSVRFQEGPLLAKPSFSVGSIVLHDLRAECEDQFVVLTSGWRNSPEDTLRPGFDMLVDNSLVMFKFSRCEQWLLRRRTGWRVLVDRIQDGVFDHLARYRGGQRVGSGQ